jgi:hypothetical protein
MDSFKKELTALLNKACAEKLSNTPDVVLAKYLITCLYAFDEATKSRDQWYSVHLEPGNSYFEERRGK